MATPSPSSDLSGIGTQLTALAETRRSPYEQTRLTRHIGIRIVPPLGFSQSLSPEPNLHTLGSPPDLWVVRSPSCRWDVCSGR